MVSISDSGILVIGTYIVKQNKSGLNPSVREIAEQFNLDEQLTENYMRGVMMPLGIVEERIITIAAGNEEHKMSQFYIKY